LAALSQPRHGRTRLVPAESEPEPRPPPRAASSARLAAQPIGRLRSRSAPRRNKHVSVAVQVARTQALSKTLAQMASFNDAVERELAEAREPQR
jgi:hypothetical protein